MKKCVLLILLIFGAALATTASAALKCSDLTGTWRGAPPPYDSVKLDLDNYYGNLDGDLHFKEGNMSDGAPGLESTCKIQADGTVKVHFYHSVTGLGTVDLYVTLLSPKVLQLEGHVPLFPEFNGQLTKS